MKLLRAPAQKRIVDYLSLKGSPSVGMNSPGALNWQSYHVLCGNAAVPWLKAEAGREGSLFALGGVWQRYGVRLKWAPWWAGVMAWQWVCGLSTRKLLSAPVAPPFLSSAFIPSFGLGCLGGTAHLWGYGWAATSPFLCFSGGEPSSILLPLLSSCQENSICLSCYKEKNCGRSILEI